tara:strand:+ start:104 stop:520 length:417 start_codon:yes stop_codon:yes gene_type:complete
MSKNRKKFKETKLGQFLLGKSGVFQTLAETIPDKGVLGVLKNLIVTDSSLPKEDKETALKMLEIEIEEMDSVTRRWEADLMSDSWLSKNVRPISLVFLTLVYATGFFMEYDLNIINQLMLLVYGAYFGSRGLEKIRKL